MQLKRGAARGRTRPGLSLPLVMLGTGSLLMALSGCQAEQVAQQFSGSYDQAIGRIYEQHVLRNLARCDDGEYFVQLGFSNFSTSVTLTGMVSAEVTLYDSPQVTDGSSATTTFKFFRQSFSPTISGSQATTLSFVASPTGQQAEVAEVYRRAVAQPESERLFRVTQRWADALQAYCAVPKGLNRWYVVPAERKAAFCDFVRQVSFLSPSDVPTLPPKPGPAPPNAADTDRRKDVIPDPAVPPGSLIPPVSKPGT